MKLNIDIHQTIATLSLADVRFVKTNKVDYFFAFLVSPKTKKPNPITNKK
jgi:hypothetical protein